MPAKVLHSQYRADKHGDILIHLGPSETGRQVDVVVEPVAQQETLDSYQARMKRLAGAWEGDKYGKRRSCRTSVQIHLN